MTSDGAKFDLGKPKLALVDSALVRQVAWVLTYGCAKYEPDRTFMSRANWKDVPNGLDRYTDALMRHLYAFTSGEMLDPESGMAHMAHVGFNVMAILFLLEKEGKIPTEYDLKSAWEKWSAARAAKKA